MPILIYHVVSFFRKLCIEILIHYFLKKTSRFNNIGGHEEENKFNDKNLLYFLLQNGSIFKKAQYNIIQKSDNSKGKRPFHG